MRRRRPKRAWDTADRLLNWFLYKPGWLPFAVSPLSVAAVTVTLWSIHNTLVVALVVGLGVGYVVLAAGTAALVQRYERRQLLAFEYRLARLRRLSWEELEVVVAEVFRADGYAVVETGQAGPDGGVDLVLNRGSQKTFVQCKQMPGWLDVRPLREFYGVMCIRAPGCTGVVRLRRSA